MKGCFTIHRTIEAPAERVFDALTDHRNYSNITPMRVSTLVKEGAPEPNGVGAVRKLGLAGPPIVEEVIGYERPTFFSYKVLSGLPVKEQVGEVRLRDVGGRTELSYTVSYTGRIPRSEPVLGVVQRQAIGALVRGIAKSVE